LAADKVILALVKMKWRMVTGKPLLCDIFLANQ